MGSAILLITTLVALLAERTQLSITGRLQPRRGHPEILQVALDRAGPLLAEHQIVSLGAALIAVSFDDHSFSGSAVDPGGIGTQGRLGVPSDRILIEIEEDVSEAQSFSRGRCAKGSGQCGWRSSTRLRTASCARHRWSGLYRFTCRVYRRARAFFLGKGRHGVGRDLLHRPGALLPLLLEADSPVEDVTFFPQPMNGATMMEHRSTAEMTRGITHCGIAHLSLREWQSPAVLAGSRGLLKT